MFKQFTVEAALSASDPEIRLVGAGVGEGRLHSLVVTQRAGTNAGFSVEVYSKKGSCPPNFPAVDAADAPTVDSRAFLVTGPVAASGDLAAWFDPVGQPFCNADSTSRTPVNELYVRIVPTTSAVGKTFDVSLGIAAL